MDAIVLAGGKATRLEGVDKAALSVGGRRLLDRVLDAVGGAARIVVVGEPRTIDRSVTWTREEPAGSGPVAAMAAGLAHVDSDLVAVVAVDLPFLNRTDLAALGAAAVGRDGAIFVDEQRNDQPLAGVYRAACLRAALDGLPAVAGASMRSVIAGLDLARLVNQRVAHDCDTREDVENAERALQRR